MNSSESNKQVAVSHTPGPWRIDPDYYRDIQTADGMLEIGSTESMEQNFDKWRCSYPQTDRQAAANARRIVACVNYCDGADTNALELDAKTGRTASVVLPQLTEKVIALESQRDQLETKVADLELALFAENQKRQDVERQSGVLLAALDGLLAEHAVPSSGCKDRPAYEKALAAIAAVKGGAE